MQRDNQDNQDQAGDPEEELRRRVLSQVSADQPADEPAAGPTLHADDPPFNPPATEPAPWEPQPSDPQPPLSFQPPPIQTNDPPWTPPGGDISGGPAPASASVGAGIPWNPGADHPSYAPPGYHWDAKMANFVPDAAAAGAAGPMSLQGFDTGKLNDPTHSNEKYTQSVRLFASAVQGLDPVSTPLSTVVAKINAAGGHAVAVGEDRIDFGDGAGPIDVKIDSGRGGWWFQNGQDRLGGAAGQTAAAPAAGQAGPVAASGARSVSAPGAFNLSSSAASGSPTAGAPAGLWNSDFTNQLRQLLMSRLSAASSPVDPNDPNITGPMNAARDEATRGSDRERTALAERLYAQGGLNTGSIDQQIQQSGEKNALGLSSLRATLMTREYASRRDELKSLLQMAIQSQDAESARAIQAQLGELDATVRREGLGADLAKYSAYLNALGSEQVMN